MDVPASRRILNVVYRFDVLMLRQFEIRTEHALASVFRDGATRLFRERPQPVKLAGSHANSQHFGFVFSHFASFQSVGSGQPPRRCDALLRDVGEPGEAPGTRSKQRAFPVPRPVSVPRLSARSDAQSQRASDRAGCIRSRSLLTEATSRMRRGFRQKQDRSGSIVATMRRLRTSCR